MIISLLYRKLDFDAIPKMGVDLKSVTQGIELDKELDLGLI
jgi:hypothetical protein